MADLFSMLNAAARTMDAQRYGLDVTGQNIANVNTPGFARRTIQFGEVPPPDAWSAGGGVDVVAVRAARAPLLEARLRQEAPAGAREGAVAEQLAIVEAGLGLPGASLDAALSRFYNAYGSLAQHPTSTTARQQVIVEGQSLSASFNEMAGRFASARSSADAEIREALTQVNTLAREIAGLNAGIIEPGSASVEMLRDRQAVALAQLVELVDVNVIQRNDGGIDVSIGNGRALVVGGNTYAVNAVSEPPDGFARLIADGAAVPTDVTSEIAGGRIGGLLQVRDALVPSYADRLDRLAYEVATDVNDLTTAGFDLAGNAGVAFFTPPAAVTGAARSLAVSTTVAADPRLIVAADAPAAGNNKTALAIAVLQDAPIAGGSSRPVGAWGELVYAVATDGRAAEQARDGHAEIAVQLRHLRDQISGVSIDEEAAMLMRFQRAYEANARFFQTANETLDILMQLARG